MTYDKIFLLVMYLIGLGLFVHGMVSAEQEPGDDLFNPNDKGDFYDQD